LGKKRANGTRRTGHTRKKDEEPAKKQDSGTARKRKRRMQVLGEKKDAPLPRRSQKRVGRLVGGRLGTKSGKEKESAAHRKNQGADDQSGLRLARQRKRERQKYRKRQRVGLHDTGKGKVGVHKHAKRRGAPFGKQLSTKNKTGGENPKKKTKGRGERKRVEGTWTRKLLRRLGRKE